LFAAPTGFVAILAIPAFFVGL